MSDPTNKTTEDRARRMYESLAKRQNLTVAWNDLPGGIRDQWIATVIQCDCLMTSTFSDDDEKS